MEIKRNDPNALLRFVELNLQWIEELHSIEPSDQYMADHPEIYIQGNNSVFSVHSDNIVAGVCALKQDETGEYELTKMAVDTHFRGRGIGDTLMQAVEDYAKGTLGLSKIYLISNQINAAAIRLYKRRDWVVTHLGPHPRYARADIMMEKIF